MSTPPQALRRQLSRCKQGLMRRWFRLRFSRQPYAPDAHPMGVNLYGYLSSSIGLGEGARLHAEVLRQTGLPFSCVDTTPLLRGQTLPDADAPYAVSVMHVNPDLLPALLLGGNRAQWNGRYLIGIWLWELERIPRAWRAFLPVFDEFWAPSHFIEEALRKETDKPVVFLPYGMEVPEKAPMDRAAFGLPAGFLVLCMFDLRSFLSRKNPAAAIRAFAEAFTPQDDAFFVMKVHNASPVDMAQMEALAKDIKHVIINEEFSKPQVNALIACCDVFISLHRSEGFGLILAEAMLLEVPVIATNWSSTTDFTDADSALLVDYTLVPSEPGYAGDPTVQRWADADASQAAGYLRTLYESPEKRAALGKAGRKKIEETLSPALWARRMQERVRAIEGKNTKQ